MSLRILFLSTIALLGIGVRSDADAALNADPFACDPTFYDGNAIPDRFAAVSADRTFVAQKAVKLTNGDVVVAGLVPPGFQADQANGYFNVGLVRYGSSGDRVSWPHANPEYDYYFLHTYIAYPNSEQARFTGVRDIKAFNGFLYVLADYRTAVSNADVRILVFSEDGRFVQWTGAFATGLDEYGAGLAPYAYQVVRPGGGIVTISRIVAVATYAAAGTGRAVITAKRFDVETDGHAVLDTTFGPYGNGANDYPAPNAYCEAGSQCSVRAAAVAVTQGIGLLGDRPRVYVGAESLWSGNDRDAAVLAIDGSSGDALSFGINGFARYPFDVGGDFNEITVGVAASGRASDDDEIYLVSQVSMSCRPGVGVLKLDSHGARVAAFGNFEHGKTIFGGSNQDTCPAGALSTLPKGIALQDDRVAVVGTEGYVSPILGFLYEPLLAIVGSRDGTVRESRALHPSHTAGAAYASGGGWNDVVANGDARFVATGPLYDSLGSKSLFGTAGFVSDRIFGDDFGQP